MFGFILDFPHPLLMIKILALLGIFGQAFGNEMNLQTIKSFFHKENLELWYKNDLI